MKIPNSTFFEQNSGGREADFWVSGGETLTTFELAFPFKIKNLLAPCLLALKKFFLQVADVMASLGFIAPPPKILGRPKFTPPLISKPQVPLLIYLVGLLAILDPHINKCVGPPNTCIALKQFNILPPNKLF